MKIDRTHNSSVVSQYVLCGKILDYGIEEQRDECGGSKEDRRSAETTIRLLAAKQ